MPFSKSFPRRGDKRTYPEWEEVFLTDAEEREQEARCRSENIALMQECLEDAKAIMAEKKLKDFDTNQVRIALALFEKRGSHAVHYKESKAKEKFDALYGNG